jgi:hypothetical protein
MCNPTRKEATFSVGSKIGEGFGEWSEALLRIKEGWVVVTLQGSALQKTAEFTLQKNCLTRYVRDCNLRD